MKRYLKKLFFILIFIIPILIVSCDFSLPSRSSKTSTSKNSSSTTTSKSVSSSSASTSSIKNKYTSLKADFSDIKTKLNIDDGNISANIYLDELVYIYSSNGIEPTKYLSKSIELFSDGYLYFLTKANITLYRVDITYQDDKNNLILNEGSNKTSSGFTTYENASGFTNFYLNASNKAIISGITLYYDGDINVLNNINYIEIDFTNNMYLDYKKNVIASGNFLPSSATSGNNPKMLVVPVSLDSTIDSATLSTYLSNIKASFIGTSKETGFESVKSYFYKSSNGICNLDITVVDEWFKSKTYTKNSLKSAWLNYASGRSSESPLDVLLEEVLDYYDSFYDYSEFDSDKDGYIDSIYLVYDCDIETDGTSSTPYWAFTTYSMLTYDTTSASIDYKHDNVYGGYYTFAAAEFSVPGTYASYNYDNIIVDAHTYIHETGHLFGLDDYYDYSEYVGCNRGLYGASMMDYNIGDMDPYSKLLLDWVNPTIIYGRGNIDINLNSFEDYGDIILISDHEITSIYDNYYIIEYYNNNGLNKNDEPISGSGVRILKAASKVYKDVDGNPAINNTGNYSSTFKNNNTDTSVPQIEMIYNNNLQKLFNSTTYTLTKSNLYGVDETYSNSIFSFTVEEQNDTYIKLNITIF